MRHFLKKYFIAGTLVLAPLAVMVWVFKTIAFWSESFVETFLPIRLQEITLFGHEVPGLGIFLTCLLILLIGILTRLYFGRKLLSFGDWLIYKIPLGSGIYTSTKKLLSALISGGEKNFRQVVLVEFPKPGSRMIGFVTGESADFLQTIPGKTCINVFIPTTPNPTSGFLLIVPRDQVIPIDIGPDQAFKLIVSGGTIHS